MNTDYETLEQVVQQLNEIFLQDIENDSTGYYEFNIITKPWGYEITFNDITIWNSEEDCPDNDDSGHYIFHKVLEQCKENFINNVLHIYKQIINNYKNYSKDSLFVKYCGKCEKDFEFTRNVEVTYSTYKLEENK